jgi:phage baseplate assembly protein V
MGGKNLLADTDFAKGNDSRFKSSLMIGRVSSIECTETAANVRVLIPDRLDHGGQPLITKPVPVLQPAASKKKSFAIPRIGTNVLLAKLPNGTSDYAVIGSFYTTKDPPPVTDPNLDHVEYEDGSVIEFDAGSGTMKWDLKGGITLECVGDLTLKSSGALLVDAPNIHLKGAMNFEGDIIHTGNINTSGRHTDSGGHHTSSETTKKDEPAAAAMEESRYD